MLQRFSQVCLWLGAAAVACSSPPSGAGGAGADGGAGGDAQLTDAPAGAALADALADGVGVCTPGTTQGCEGVASVLRCNAAGSAWESAPCQGIQQCVAGACEDVVCTPGAASCLDATHTRTCKADGSDYEAAVPCPEQKQCVGGTCVGACEASIKIANNVGCEYWSVDLDVGADVTAKLTNSLGVTPDLVPHHVVISNPGSLPATLQFELSAHCANGDPCSAGAKTCGASASVCHAPGAPYLLPVANPVVPAKSSVSFEMPVMNAESSSMSPTAIHIRSDQPVMAYQFNPFHNEGSAAHEGSLLLPQNVLGTTYIAVTLPSIPTVGISWTQYGYLTVVATAQGATKVQVTPSIPVVANPAAGVPQGGGAQKELPAGVVATFVLQRFDVLTLAGKPAMNGQDSLTGTRIAADRPVAVFAGHEETGLANSGWAWDPNDPNPKTDCCLEHLEEQLMPLQSWGSEVLCAKSKSRGGEKDWFWVVAGADNVALHTQPAVAGLDGKTLAKQGDVIKVESEVSFLLTASKKIQVVQFLVSQGQTLNKTGDPAMAIVPSVHQFRTDYGVLIPDGFAANWLSVLRPPGQPVQLDGQEVAGFKVIGGTAWELAYFKVAAGVHQLAAAQPFGLQVYGYDDATAYAYPGGMNLQ